jgi:hypothetical protein
MLRIDPVRAPLDHFDLLDDGAQCDCDVCSAWKLGRSMADSAAGTRPLHHPTCHCQACRPAHQANYVLQALNSRRDLWIEGSFHASLHRYGPTYMEWLAEEMADKDRTMGWWANEATRHPMSFWFERFEQAVRTGVVALTGVASGAFNFIANYLDIEEEGGGLASASWLLVDDIQYDSGPPEPLANPRRYDPEMRSILMSVREFDARLSSFDVAQIRRMRREGFQIQEIAAFYRVGRLTISHIIHDTSRKGGERARDRSSV